ncbi:MAG: PmoA family protein [Bacteroidales bacterium]|nr:PmoA family protein [Bacteroidales bacterium]
MEIIKYVFTGRRLIKAMFVIFGFLLSSGTVMNAQPSKDKGVKLVRIDDKHKVDVIINGALFTSYQYPDNIEKPFLFPVIAPNGSVITRGYPIEPRKGERVDHPHHIGIWFNHGNVNGLDFWNNSSAIPADKKDLYGHIVLQKILKAESGKKGTLEIVARWDDNKGNTLLTENTTYIFSGDKNSRTIDHITRLTAVNGPVTIGESKEGLFAIRVDRAFEMPSNESLIFTDANGNPTTVKATDNTGVTGMYTSDKGLKGDAVWGTRNDWVVLTGVKDNVTISFGIFDNPKNPGYPAYAHARGYGLFSVNNLGQNAYDPKQEKISYKLAKGESMTLRHRFYVQSGSEIKTDSANKIFKAFSILY